MRNDPIRRSTRSNSATDPSSCAFSSSKLALGTSLWFDQAVFALCTSEKTVLLTPHEARVLQALPHPPNQCHHSEGLMRKLKKSGPSDLQRHALQQTISGLRHKLDLCGQYGRLLHTRHGFGYMLLLNQSGTAEGGTFTDTQEAERGQAMPSLARCSHEQILMKT